MFHPKRFYRELEILLHDIDDGILYSEWYPRIVEKIVDRFGDALSITSGRVWIEDEGGYRLEFGLGNRGDAAEGLLLPYDYPPLRLVVEHRVYLFDETTPGVSPDVEKRLGGLESAALLVPSEPRRVLAFGLKKGWERDHLDFALNTIRNAIDHRLRFQDLATDLEQTAEIQRSLLPTEPPPLPGYEIAARSVAASRVGGDFYDYLPLDPETVVIAVGDASGHGLAAALLARDVVTGLRMGTERSLKMTEVIYRLNRVIARSVLSTRFASLFYGEIDSDGNVFYVNAGHPAPWVVGADRVRRLEVGGPILGPMTVSTYRRGWAPIEPDDLLVILTDGVIEHANDAGEHFGEERVERVLADRRGAPAEEILSALFDAAERHAGGRPWADDRTAVVVVRHPATGSEPEAD